MYKNLFDEKHRYIVTSNSSIINKTSEYEPPQSGIYEANILCKSCDNSFLSILERYFSVFFHSEKISIEKSPKLIPKIDLNGNKFFYCSNTDYGKLKLFFLSILWRSSISKKEFFKDINLGPHEEKIRKMVFENNPGNVDEYPVMLSIVDQSSGSPNDYIGQPRFSRFEGHHVATFWISSILFSVYVSSHPKPAKSIEMSLQPNGEFILPYLTKSEAWNLMLKFSGLK
ncbi:hypothetical protein [Algoriphagus sp. A40]|uniref:hypothetical protein n=1 Tax=Algoriphagus sp. A40 TaxID=1945863 RepID=UPI0011158296|nr:hypothetical protein [Algoriphagus sp. A40]